jgi:predicted TIM-barrel fold metal-dependent hydrolase
MEEMERQVKDLKIDAWKMYTGAELGEKAWFMNDEKVAYPFWEKTKKLGVKNLCIHKGLPLGFFNEKACTPLDLEKAAKDWPDLNFIVYHSGFPSYPPAPFPFQTSRRLFLLSRLAITEGRGVVIERTFRSA